MTSGILGIVNYGGGNIFSLTATLNRAGIAHKLVDGIAQEDGCERYIIPGVGHAGRCMERLNASGMADALRATTKPVLGICVGMQLLTAFSEEGAALLLGSVPLRTQKFTPDTDLKIPHMGWNAVIDAKSALFTDIEPNTYFYFVHSYYVELSDKYTIGLCQHGKFFSAAIQRDNYYGVQFHPEKSGAAGAQLLINFTKI